MGKLSLGHEVLQMFSIHFETSLLRQCRVVFQASRSGSCQVWLSHSELSQLRAEVPGDTGLAGPGSRCPEWKLGVLICTRSGELVPYLQTAS